jgi:RimJ/RimL family protein N-acetyltransferase
MSTLLTDRLEIRPFVAADALHIYRLNTDMEVMRHLPKDEVYTNVEEARLFLERYLKQMQQIPFAREAVIRKADGAWLGWCGLKMLGDGEVDLGFRFHRAYWGKGYASESGKAWVDYGLGIAGLKRIIGNAAVGNIGSQRTLEKLGFRRYPEEDCTELGFDWLRYEILG